ncbi:MAG: FHA domain-containing protein [Proteobacteria bacterium]|nr:FHA domain-containing protein [Pseudomonadota bacterium]
MAVDLHTLEELRRRVAELGREAFVAEYPGVFLVALGFLAVEQIRGARRQAPGGGKAAGHGETAAVTFAVQRRHDAQQQHPLAGLAFLLRTDPTGPGLRLGRSQRCDITIPDASVSDLHGLIEIHATLSGPQVAVIDTNSTNGTSVNLERVEPGERRVLVDEDIVSLGRYSFQLLRGSTLYEEMALLNVLGSA